MDIKTVIGNRITQSRKALGITIKELAARTERLSAARISNWEQCTRSPKPLEAKLLAQHLQVSAAYLLGLTDNVNGDLSLSARHGSRAIPLIPLAKARAIKQQLDTSANTTPQEIDATIMVDTLNHAGDGALLLAMRPDDSSMQPHFHPGDIIVVDVTRAVKPGDYVVVYVVATEQTVLRQYREVEGGVCQLLASNELWKHVVIQQPNDMEVLGVVVEQRHYF